MEASKSIETMLNEVNINFKPGDPDRYEAIDKELKEKFDILAEVEL